MDRRSRHRQLLVTTSVAALLAGTGVSFPARGQNITDNGSPPFYSAPINSGHLDYILIENNAVVNGDIFNFPSGTIGFYVPGGSLGLYGGAPPFAPIEIGNSTLNGSILNLGTIAGFVASASPGQAYGISISGATVTGSIGNSGTITAQNTQATAIFISQSTIGGGISNSGLIAATASNRSAQGISVPTGPVFTGNIANGGTITVHGATNAAAIFVNTHTFVGSITNSGLIAATATASNGPAAGIDVGGSQSAVDSFSGGIANAGTIDVSASGNATGIFANAATLAGAIVNSGTIGANGGNTAYGIAFNGATLGGGATNMGLILTSASNGSAFSIHLNGETLGGGIVNGGTLDASGRGARAIDVAAGAFTGGITNSRLVLADGTELHASAIAISSSTFSGSIVNGGTIGAIGGQGASGIDFGGRSFIGSITNSGSISALATAGGAYGIHVSASTFVGAVVNSGTVGIAAGSYAYGVAVSAGSLAGSVANSGTISAGGDTAAHGIHLDGGTFSGSVTNTGLIAATGSHGTAYGIDLSLGTFTGSIGNRGTIHSSGADAAYAVLFTGSIFGSGITNSGLITATGSIGDARGIDLSAGTFSGGISNAATIVANGGETAHGIHFDGAAFGNGITNAGLIAATGTLGSAYGIDLFAGSFGGNIANAGTILAMAGKTATGIYVSAGTLAGTVTNSGLIQATGTLDAANGIYVDNAATFIGSVVNSGTIVAGGGGGGIGINASGNTFLGSIVNSGLILAGASASAGNGSAFVAAGGILAAGNTFAGGIVNRGLIAVGGSIDLLGGVTNIGSAGAGAYGIDVASVSFVGGIVNSGSISSIVDINFLNGSTNSGTLSAAAYGIEVPAATFAGSIANDGTILVSAGARTAGSAKNSGPLLADAYGIEALATSFAGGIANRATVLALAYSASNAQAYGVAVGGGSFAGGVSNTGLIRATAQYAVNGNAYGIVVSAGSFAGGIVNTGAIDAYAHSAANMNPYGILVGGGYFAGGITNSGLVRATANYATNAYAVAVAVPAGTFAGGISNSGLISADALAYSAGHSVVAAAEGILAAGGTFGGGIANRGTMLASALIVPNPGTIVGKLRATAVDIQTASFLGGISNSGLILARATGGTGIGIKLTGSLAGAIVNTGTIAGNTSAIDFSVAIGSAVIDQQAGALIGAVNLSSHADQFVISGGTILGNITGTGSNGDTVTFAPGAGNSFVYGAPAAGYTLSNVLNVNLASGTLVLAPQSRIGTLPNGTYSQAAGATLALQLTPDTTPGRYPSISAGTVSVNGGALQAIPLLSTTGTLFPDASTYRQIIYWGTLNSGFGSVTSTSPLLTPSLALDGNGQSYDLTLTRVGFGAVPGLGPNQRSVGGALEHIYDSGPSGQTQQLLSTLFGLNPQQYRQALNDLSGQGNGQALSTLLGLPRALVDTVDTRLATGGAYNGGGLLPTASLAPLASQMAAAADALFDDDLDAPENDQSDLLDRKWGFWVRGYGIFADAPTTATSAPFSQTTSGVILGLDTPLSDHLVVGGAVNYADAALTYSDGSGLQNVKSYELSGYGRYEAAEWYANGVGTFSWNDYNTTHMVAMPGLGGTATGSFNGQTYGLYGEIGRRLYPRLAMPGLVVTPLLGLGYVHAHTAAFTETGAGLADLNAGAGDANSLQTSIGARLSTSFDVGDGDRLTPELRAVWQHEFLDATTQLSQSFVQMPGGIFTVQGTTYSRETALVGAGVAYDMSSAMRLFIDYDAQLNSGFTAHAISGGLKMKF